MREKGDALATRGGRASSEDCQATLLPAHSVITCRSTSRASINIAIQRAANERFPFFGSRLDIGWSTAIACGLPAPAVDVLPAFINRSHLRKELHG